VFRTDGLPKIGCRRVSAALVGFDLVRPGLTLSQEPKMLFHIEGLVLLSFEAANSQLMSGMDGPLPWTDSLIWSAFFLISSFHGSPPGARPLISSLAKRAFD